MGMKTGWSGVRERLVAVVEAEHRAHGWAPSLEPVLTAAEIAEVEAQYGVELPHEYRTFLAEVGAGGPGPGCELNSLIREDGLWGWVWDGSEPIPLDPSGPFVQTEDWPAQQIATLRAAGYEPTTPDEEDDYLDDYRKAFGGDDGEVVFDEERTRGAILISDYGCGMTGWLIAVGPHRGEFRHRDCAVNPPFEPELDVHGNRHTFRTWYLEWLEEREREAP